MDDKAAMIRQASELFQCGRREDAVSVLDRLIRLDPASAEVHSALGVLLQQLGRSEEALASLQRAVALKPRYPQAWSNLGCVLRTIGRLDEAAEAFGKAVAQAPRLAEAWQNLGNLETQRGRHGEAAACFRRAVAFAPESAAAWANLAEALGAAGPTHCAGTDKQERSLLARLLRHPNVDPTTLAMVVPAALRGDAAVDRLLALNRPPAGTELAELLPRLAKVDLFIAMLETAPIADRDFEMALTALRAGMAEAAAGGVVPSGMVTVAAALAAQCFLNEYCYLESEAETALVARLRAMPQSPAVTAVLAAYRPLEDRSGPPELAALVRFQVEEGHGIAALRPAIPLLRPAHGGVSDLVKAQYEDYPYPRWRRVGLPTMTRPWGPVPPAIAERLPPPDPSRPVEVLIAGCGTGAHSIRSATAYTRARVLAVDLSTASLAYAQYKSCELGVEGITYAQADILGLGDFDRHFDVIECGGVLHHLDDPLAGWRILTGLLRPGGLMFIGLYSAIARRPVEAARTFAAERGHGADAEGIRRFRAEVLALPDDHPAAGIRRIGDFYSLSGCRDLALHVKEHTVTLPMVAEWLDALQLEFLGFAGPPARAGGGCATLADWHRLELDCPSLFIGMYQFWVRRGG
jgi:Flp pilus assembly protein TadD/SAM-dependent methyltransferase